MAHRVERGLGLRARKPRRIGARQLALERRLVDVGRQELIRLDAALVEQPEPARRSGGEHELGPADHASGHLKR
jgi:hypothetical protein